jgi:hypothetical protein
MKRLFCLLIGLGFISGSPELPAQTIPDSLLTAATVTTDAAGRSWAYVAISPENTTVLRGRSLAVYLKNGLPADPGTFTAMGRISAELEASLMGVFLERGRQLGENLAELDAVLYDLYRTRGATKNTLSSNLPTPPKPALADMLSSLLNRAVGDADTYNALRMLGQAHPSVRMALGEAWAAPLTAAPGQPVTLEVREWTTAGDAGVVARLTVTAGQPIVLPAPGPPVQVTDLSPQGDLNIKLHWDQGDSLRRQSPLSRGFHVWRVTRAFATAQGVESTAPSLLQLKSWLTAGTAVLSTEKPIIAKKNLTSAGAAYFFTDDGNRYRKNALGENVDVPFQEGAEYTYFVTSVDILGRDGPPSLPGHGIVCRTLPPPVPGSLRAVNDWTPGTDLNLANGTQTILFSWKANTNTARDVTTFYEVYRGTDLRELGSIGAKAALNAAGPIAPGQLHQVDGAQMAYLDNDPTVSSRAFGETLWYSVRAVHISPCGPIKSDFAPPVMVARRQREGPPPPTGIVDMNCPRASVIVASQQVTFDPGPPVNDGLVRVRLLCQRLDSGIAHADLSVSIGNVVTDLGQHLFPAEGNVVAADFSFPLSTLAGQTVTAYCQSTSHAGPRSNPKAVVITNITGEGRNEVTFHTRTLSDSDLIPGEAFSDELLEAPVSAPAAATPEGTGLVINLALLNGRTVVIQTAAGGGTFSNWTRRGHAIVRDGTAYFSMPAVEEGQQQPALSGRVFAVREFGPAGCYDLAFNPGTGQAGRLNVTVFTTPRTAEYRLFRRIDEGPYTLVGQGGALYAASNPVNAVRREDEALPLTDCTICYYAQTLDRDGNGSALVRLDPCVERRMPVLPKVRLSPPEATGTQAAPKMKLTWMCPPAGVQRFLISVKTRGNATVQSPLAPGSSISLYATLPPLSDRVLSYISGGDVQEKATPTTQAATPGPSNNDSGLSALNLASGNLVYYKKLVKTQTFVTPPIGNGLPANPPFTAEFDIQVGATYSVSVQAVRGSIAGGQGRGPASAWYDFTWEPAPPEPAVPWPKRPPTEVTLAPGIEAAELDPVLWPAELNGTRPVGVRIASILDANPNDELFEQGGAYIFAPTPGSTNFNRHDPNAHVLAPIGNKTTQVLGVVMYRQQVANTLFPMVAGDTLQVSPLVKKIAWAATTYAGRTGALLADPLLCHSNRRLPHPHPAPLAARYPGCGRRCPLPLLPRLLRQRWRDHPNHRRRFLRPELKPPTP